MYSLTAGQKTADKAAKTPNPSKNTSFSLKQFIEILDAVTFSYSGRCNIVKKEDDVPISGEGPEDC